MMANLTQVPFQQVRAGLPRHASRDELANASSRVVPFRSAELAVAFRIGFAASPRREYSSVAIWLRVINAF